MDIFSSPKGVVDISTSPKNHENESTVDFCKVKVKRYQPNVKQDNPTQFLAFSGLAKV